MKLTIEYYLNEDVVFLARDLLGKVLVTRINGQIRSGMITETEAYAGETDRASHAWNGRRTSRTETMYQQGGRAYVYLCYGIHHLFNVVTNRSEVPHAVLIRGILPLEGKEIMQPALANKGKWKTDGPGKLTKAMGITTRYDNEPLLGNRIWIEDRKISLSGMEIINTPRIGVDYAGEDALLPYRFLLK